MTNFLITVIDELIFRPAVWLINLRPNDYQEYWQEELDD